MTDITVICTSNHNDALYFEHLGPNGHLTCVYRENIGQYTLADIEVEERHREKGLGKLLLKSSLEHARQIKANYLVSMIVSRECLDAMTSVFGAENIQVEQKGKYIDDIETEDDATSALLYYELDDRYPHNFYSRFLHSDRLDS